MGGLGRRREEEHGGEAAGVTAEVGGFHGVVSIHS